MLLHILFIFQSKRTRKMSKTIRLKGYHDDPLDNSVTVQYHILVQEKEKN